MPATTPGRAALFGTGIEHWSWLSTSQGKIRGNTYIPEPQGNESEQVEFGEGARGISAGIEVIGYVPSQLGMKHRSLGRIDTYNVSMRSSKT